MDAGDKAMAAITRLFELGREVDAGRRKWADAWNETWETGEQLDRAAHDIFVALLYHQLVVAARQIARDTDVNDKEDVQVYRRDDSVLMILPVPTHPDVRRKYKGSVAGCQAAVHLVAGYYMFVQHLSAMSRAPRGKPRDEVLTTAREQGWLTAWRDTAIAAELTEYHTR